MLLYEEGDYMKIGQKEFDFSKNTYIMGILNATPDSFSDGGHYNKISQAILQARKMVSEGADIIDIGGESTRPGHYGVSEEEELNRVIPIIKELVKEIKCPIAINSFASLIDPAKQ